ncbi:NUDIX domain-containing protein [Saccharopolyspora rhizosphaerae]|uniref:NUDIX domain-containing protein n=1 Tax=Saccharopolyspora rhizosphaerae TaxID=2492662 RepID=A0A3R8QRJ8_9PSEU|nr:NUDIX domain-containing protein [Saccharopolyspora rhizosphaerae]RRO18040.1 NUDIX domain-containing protein [Saccharopolyspora rhizosphaerae]
MSKRSAGILLYRAEGPRVLIVHPGGPFFTNKDAGAWSLPKGEHDPDEDPRAAALREFAEETGTSLDGRDLLPLGEVRQRNGKVVTAWAVEGDFDVDSLHSNTFEIEWPPRSGRRTSFPEVDRALWCDPDTAREKLNPAQVAFVDRLLEQLKR